jgi:hypothetical protein
MLVLDLEELHNGRGFLPGLTLMGIALMLGKRIELFLKGVNSLGRRLVLGMTMDNK